MNPDDRKCIMIIAGEASGDLHGAKLVRALHAKNNAFFFCGIGGRHLSDAGVKICMDASKLSVVGITEAFSKLPKLYKSSRLVKKLLTYLSPDLLILIDFPDFNLNIAASAKNLGIPVLYYISPQIWAWRKGRVEKIRRRVDHMAVILPFEEQFYRDHGVPATFVGHPLLDMHVCPDDKPAPFCDGDPRVVGFFPGSRDREVSRHLPLMIRAARILVQQWKGLRFIVSMAPSVRKKQVEDILDKHRGSLDIEPSADCVEEIFEKTCLAVAASGTVTLEAALSGTPLVIIYRVSPISYWLGRALIRVRHIGLVNLIADRQIVPELIQADASPENIAAAVSGILGSEPNRERIRKELSRVREMLGGPGASERVCEIAMGLLYGNPPV